MSSARGRRGEPATDPLETPESVDEDGWSDADDEAADVAGVALIADEEWW